MMVFLDCRQQFREEAEEGELELHTPCRIHVERGLVGDPGPVLILVHRTHGNTEELDKGTHTHAYRF